MDSLMAIVSVLPSQSIGLETCHQEHPKHDYGNVMEHRLAGNKFGLPQWQFCLFGEMQKSLAYHNKLYREITQALLIKCPLSAVKSCEKFSARAYRDSTSVHIGIY
jgi:hypothetical protein